MPSTSSSNPTRWIPSFGTGYILGIDGIALALVALTAVLVPLLIVAGWNDASDRSGLAGRSTHTYLALTLAVEGMVLISLVSLDVLLFYVFFEAMLIPMYFLIGGFGGENRSKAAVKFLLYNLFGGLIMLAAVIGLYVVTAQSDAFASGTFDFREIVAAVVERRVRHESGSCQRAVPRLHVRVRGQGAAVAVASLAARRRSGGHPGQRGADDGRHGQGRHVRHAALLPAVVPRCVDVFPSGDHRARGRSASSTGRSWRSARPTSCG